MKYKKNKEEVKIALESGIYKFEIPINKKELVRMIFDAYKLGWNDCTENIKRKLGGRI